MKRKYLLICCVIAALSLPVGCSPIRQETQMPALAALSLLVGCSHIRQEVQMPTPADESQAAPEEWSCYHIEGTTLETRINPPQGYLRPEAEEGSLDFFLRNYPVKEHGAPVRLYNGEQKENQTAHAAVLCLPLEGEDFQQCADSIMRIFAEYFWSLDQPEKIAFHFTADFTADYIKWRDGYRIRLDGEEFSWVKNADYDDSYENFTRYLRTVFAYAGTFSMDTWEAEPIPLDELQIGDVFLKGGSPGHVMLVADICVNEDGKKAFLLAQGYMPAQEFHIVKNPAHPDDPWYYEEEVRYPFSTIEYVFPEESLQRLSYLQPDPEDQAGR